jgi:hypothetical protein
MQAAQAFQETFARAAGDGQPSKLGLTQETVSISASRTKGDDVGMRETSNHLFDFFRTQLARALTNQHSVLIIHCVAPFFLHFWVV